MPTKRIGDLLKSKGWEHMSKKPCFDPDHHPDRRNLKPGIYEHVCPSCGSTKRFSVYQ